LALTASPPPAPPPARRGLFIAPFDELVDPRLLAELAARAEERGWEGLFLWDHVRYRPPVSAVADPWVALSAIASATTRLRLGPMVTPLSRRRVHKLARETVTLDHLSRGRLVMGVGLGSDRSNELGPFGEVVDARERARMLDHGLDKLSEYWAGEFQPLPVQRPRISSPSSPPRSDRCVPPKRVRLISWWRSPRAPMPLPGRLPGPRGCSPPSGHNRARARFAR
jgi:alkanesulfonate monooxygenase SsuD/methylene tetrahydromethanopterin reductase-like flavin-dependent oxidoreductase (luciferase family)